eukprot:384344-Lingulodinium_polyedra.AAC.1
MLRVEGLGADNARAVVLRFGAQNRDDALRPRLHRDRDAAPRRAATTRGLSLIHISEPTRR